MRRFITALITLAGLSFSIVPARAYTYQFADASGTIPIKWPSGAIAIALSSSLNAPPANIKAGSDVVGATRRALAHWSEAANIQFVETSSNLQTISPGSGGDGVSLITVSSLNSGEFPDINRQGRARVFFDPSTGAITEGDVAINPNVQFSTDGTSGTYDLESTLTHEIGHLLGLDHSGVTGATMQPRQGVNGYYNLPAFSARSLAEDDRAAVRSLYGPRAGTGAIAGKLLYSVNGSAATPLYGAHVWAEDATTGRLIAANVTFADGTYRIEALPPGTYRVVAEYLDDPVLAREIGSGRGPYLNLAAGQTPFRTFEISSQTNVAADATTALNLTAASNSATPTLNPRLLGINGQLSTVAAPLIPGNTYTVYVGGEGVDRVLGNGVTITSPFFSVNPASVMQQQFGTSFPIISLEVTVNASAPAGDYSIRLLSTSNELAYISGGLTIETPSAPATNPIDDARYFVQQHYRDFLNREPDAGGWDYWTKRVTQDCNGDARCLHQNRISVSAAFFIELEFQETGSFVYRFYKASYGVRPTFAQFLPDRSQVVGGNNLEAGKQAFAEAFVNRAEFQARYPQSLSKTEFVDALLQSVRQGSGVELSGMRDSLVADYSATNSRARVVRLLVDNQAFQQAEYNRAFVLMQYFGYLRRDPDQAGYDFWLNILNNKDANNYRGMVCAFLTSPEYQLRFGSSITRTDRDCGQ